MMIYLLRGNLVASFRFFVMLGLVSISMSMPPNMRGHARPNVTILVIWSSVGDYAYGYYTDVMVYQKAANQLAKYKSNPAWPFLANYEVVDWQSNQTFLFSYMTKRLNNTLSHPLPPVSVILGAEGGAGLRTAHIANSFGTSTTHALLTCFLLPTSLLSFFPPRCATYPHLFQP